MRHPVVFIAWFCVLTAFSIEGQSATEPEHFTEEIVVTASGWPEPADSVPASVTIVGREQIERQAALDLAEVLRQVPGLFLTRAGSSGKQSSLFTRGVNSAHTLVMWNGIELNNPYFSGYDWGQFSTVGLEKVEIVRGPFSALHGADAVGGVVNMISGARHSGVGADVQLGERGLRNGRVEATGTGERILADLAVEHRQDDGFHPNDDFEQTSILTSARWIPGGRISVGVSGRFNDYRLGIPFSLGEPSLERRQSGRELQIALPLIGRTGRFDWDLTPSHARHEIDFRDPLDAWGPLESATDSRTNRFAGKARFDTVLGQFVAGAEIEDATVDDETLFGKNLEGAERRSRSLFVENRYSTTLGSSSLEMSAGVRLDDYEQFGSETSPRLAVGWAVGEIRIRGSYGEAFRAPSVGDLYYPFYGNPELGPETSRSLEAGLDWRRGRLLLTGVHFRNTIDGLIVFHPPTSRAENLGRAVTEGIEVGASVQQGRWRGDLSYTWLDATDSATGEDLARRPRHSGSIGLGWTEGPFGVAVSAYHAGSRPDFLPSFPFSRVVNESYTVVDLQMHLDRGNIRPYVKITNLTDETFEEVLGSPSPSRRAAVGLRYSR
jgi:vitamin B12 transporter